jgi:hypothetical protein
MRRRRVEDSGPGGVEIAMATVTSVPRAIRAVDPVWIPLRDGCRLAVKGRSPGPRP